MAKKNYDEASVLRSISNRVGINYANRVLTVDLNNPKIGNGTWGKIDYLCHYCGWMWMKSYGVKVNTNTNNTPTHKRDDKKNQDTMKKSRKK